MDVGMIHPKKSLKYWRANLLEWNKIPLWPPFSVAAGTFITKLIALLPLGGAAGWDITKGITKQTKLSPPSSPKSEKMCCNNSILFIISGFVSLWSKDKELSIMASVCNLKIPLWANTKCPPFTSNSTQKQCQGTNFLLPSWIRISFLFLLSTFIKADKSCVETYYQAVLTTSTMVRAQMQADGRPSFLLFWDRNQAGINK